MMMGEDIATNVIINERVMSDEFARLLFKLLLLHASDQAAKGWSLCGGGVQLFLFVIARCVNENTNMQ